VIPQRVPPPPFSTIKEEPVASRSLSHETAAPAPIYSGYESEEVLREVASAAKHRLDDDPPVQYYNQSFGNFPAPISYPSVPERAPQDQSRAGISVRTSDYATPWRSTFASGPSAIRRERVSLLAGLLYRAGVPSDIVRDVEIMIVVFGLVVAAGAALLIFHRQVGEGVQWVGQNVMSKNTELVEKPVGTDRLPPPDSTLSPLLQPPPGTQAPPVVEKRKPKPVVEAGGMQRPTIYAADPNAPSLVPPLPDDTGEAELASALQYLRADSGSTETNVGVKWLWASVEKGNTKAAIILADLYVWGRGVPQNCDQARVLLTAAAKRASVEAAQRLQDMEADGCVSGAKTPSH
jgi:TPR repeat protein